MSTAELWELLQTLIGDNAPTLAAVLGLYAISAAFIIVLFGTWRLDAYLPDDAPEAGEDADTSAELAGLDLQAQAHRVDQLLQAPAAPVTRSCDEPGVCQARARPCAYCCDSLASPH